ncbi:MAG TPA: ABC-2 transporter permease [Sedimentisphaerales bacterium]|nr:ABC-2 transporter permease [Sedimentisphaerales bacterium]
MIKPLIWKEWHEQRWKLVFGTVMLVFFTGVLLAAKLTTDNETFVLMWIFGGLILSMYSAMGVFAPETTDGTKIFLSSKPIQAWKIFLCKWFFGWMNFAVPMLICSTILMVIILSNREGQLLELKYIAIGTFTGICMGTTFYCMTCCFAPRKGGEAAVGFTGFIVFFVFILHAMITDFTISPQSWRSGFSIPQQLFLFINPLFWANPTYPIWGGIHQSLLVIEQTILFLFTMLIGLRKWQRRS